MRVAFFYGPFCLRFRGSLDLPATGPQFEGPKAIGDACNRLVKRAQRLALTMAVEGRADA